MKKFKFSALLAAAMIGLASAPMSAMADSVPQKFKNADQTAGTELRSGVYYNGVVSGTYVLDQNGKKKIKTIKRADGTYAKGASTAKSGATMTMAASTMSTPGDECDDISNPQCGGGIMFDYFFDASSETELYIETPRPPDPLVKVVGKSTQYEWVIDPFWEPTAYSIDEPAGYLFVYENVKSPPTKKNRLTSKSISICAYGGSQANISTIEATTEQIRAAAGEAFFILLTGEAPGNIFAPFEILSPADKLAVTADSKLVSTDGYFDVTMSDGAKVRYRLDPYAPLGGYGGNMIPGSGPTRAPGC